jgi:hypothetical protein
MTSTTETKTYDRDDVWTAIEAAVAANPTGQNPMTTGGACLNRAHDLDASTPRCIASQVHYDLTGMELGGNESATIYAALSVTYFGLGSPFDRDAVDLLGEAQGAFDSAAQSGLHWTTALTNLRNLIA